MLFFYLDMFRRIDFRLAPVVAGHRLKARPEIWGSAEQVHTYVTAKPADGQVGFNNSSVTIVLQRCIVTFFSYLSWQFKWNLSQYNPFFFQPKCYFLLQIGLHFSRPASPFPSLR